MRVMGDTYNLQCRGRTPGGADNASSARSLAASDDAPGIDERRAERQSASRDERLRRGRSWSSLDDPTTCPRAAQRPAPGRNARAPEARQVRGLRGRVSVQVQRARVDAVAHPPAVARAVVEYVPEVT